VVKIRKYSALRELQNFTLALRDEPHLSARATSELREAHVDPDALLWVGERSSPALCSYAPTTDEDI